MTSKRVLAVAFLATLVLISYFDLAGKGVIGKGGTVSGAGVSKLPNPRQLVGAGIVFGLLGVVGAFAPELAAVFGVGVVLATWMRRSTATAPGSAPTGVGIHLPGAPSGKIASIERQATL